MALINKLLFVFVLICVTLCNAYDGPLPDSIQEAVNLIVKSIKDKAETRLSQELAHFHADDSFNADTSAHTLMGARGDASDGVAPTFSEPFLGAHTLMGERGDLLDNSQIVLGKSIGDANLMGVRGDLLDNSADATNLMGVRGDMLDSMLPPVHEMLMGQRGDRLDGVLPPVDSVADAVLMGERGDLLDSMSPPVQEMLMGERGDQLDGVFDQTDSISDAVLMGKRGDLLDNTLLSAKEILMGERGDQLDGVSAETDSVDDAVLMGERGDLLDGIYPSASEMLMGERGDRLDDSIVESGSIDDAELMGARGNFLDGLAPPVHENEKLMGERGDDLDETDLSDSVDDISEDFPRLTFEEVENAAREEFGSAHRLSNPALVRAFPGAFRLPSLKAVPTASMHGGVNAASFERFLNKILPSIMDEIRRQPIENMAGEDGGFTWSVSNIQLRAFTIGSVKFQVASDMATGIAHGLTLDLTLDWKYKRVKFPWVPWGSGSAKVKGKADLGASFAMKATTTPLIVDGYRPQITISKPIVKLSDFQITVSGSLFSWLYNIIVGLFKGRIHDSIADSMREVFTKDANTMIEAMLETMPLLEPVGEYGQMDLSITKDPTFHKDEGVSLAFNGEVYLANTDRKPNPRIPRPSLTYSPTGRMVDLKLSLFTLNTAADAWYHHGGPFVRQTITKDSGNLPIPFTSEGWLVFLPRLSQKFPKAELRYHVQCTIPPEFPTLPDNSLTAALQYTLTMEALSGGVWEHAITIKARPQGGLKADIVYRNDMPYFVPQITQASLNLALEKSSIGEFHVDAVGKLIDILVNQVLIGQINKDLLQGFPMPGVNGIRFTSPQLTIGQENGAGYLLLASDLDFNPLKLSTDDGSLQAEAFEDSTPVPIFYS